MRGRTRVPTALELALWHHAVREVVRRVERSGRKDPAPPLPPSAATAEPPEAPAPGEAEAAAVALTEGIRWAPSSPPSPPAPQPLDRRTLRRLERGLHPISARLDLHGLDQQAAHDALVAFLAQAQGRGHRCVLVITGRGERTGGILRRSVPRWLEEPRLAARVLGWAEAGRAHGGAGALYILLRRASGGPDEPPRSTARPLFADPRRRRS